MGNEALQFLHERIGEYIKGHCTQEEGEYNCSPRAIALYKVLKDNPCYTKETHANLSTLEQVLGYFTRDDKGAHDKCRAILDDILEINNSGQMGGRNLHRQEKRLLAVPFRRGNPGIPRLLPRQDVQSRLEGVHRQT